MKKFEYKENYYGSKSSVIDKLNCEGADGWELVALKYTGRGYLGFFKREIILELKIENDIN